MQIVHLAGHLFIEPGRYFANVKICNGMLKIHPFPPEFRFTNFPTPCSIDRNQNALNVKLLISSVLLKINELESDKCIGKSASNVLLDVTIASCLLN